ncbi:MAG: serine/threonine protein kinase [Candidatus Bathyarchaeia archaeon]
MLENQQLQLETIIGTRASRFLTYPQTDPTEAKNRIDELHAADITAIKFRGSTRIDGIPLLGKGCVGLVVQATLNRTTIALKIRRTDANRSDMMEEARLLRTANSVNVGPRLIAATRNFLAMELFEGEPLFKWAQTQRETKTLRSILRHLLLDCFRLDAIGLDHGELSHAPKNVLVGHHGRSCIVDFETASTSRRVANVTSLLQYFMFGQLSKQIRARRLFGSRKSLLRSLSVYKEDNSVTNFHKILEELSLDAHESLL